MGDIMKKNRKPKKIYLSCKGIKKAEYKRLLNMRYNIIYEDSIEDAEFFVMPVELDGMTQRQKEELRRAEALGLKERLIKSDYFYDDPEVDVLNLDDPETEIERDRSKTSEIEEDMSLELELS